MQSAGAIHDDRAASDFFDARAEMKNQTPTAIATLAALLDSCDERVSFSAGREILDQRGLGTITI